jgi:hypothetical protein
MSFDESTSFDHNSEYWRNLGAPWGGLLTTVGDLFHISRVEAHKTAYVIFRRIRGYCTIVCALTRAFQWALARPLEMKLAEI